MTIREMHYAVKSGLNKLDSNHRNLQVPEIDWFLNQAHDVFVKSCMPQNASLFIGREFETSQRTIDSISVLVKPVVLPIVETVVSIPKDYYFYVNSYVTATKNNCTRLIRCYTVQHDDLHQESSNTVSSFEWDECNMNFEEGGIRLYPSDFKVTKFNLVYVRKPKLVYNAKDYNNGTYDYFGTTVTGTSDSELPIVAHDDIVRIAIFLASRAIELPTSNMKYEETKL